MSNFVKITDDSLKHFGVLGMKWGRRKANDTSSEFSKPQKKAIKAKKNELLNKTIQAEKEIEGYATKKLKITSAQVMDIAYSLYGSSVSAQRMINSHLSEKADLCNSYIKKNPKVVPQDMTIKYDAKKVDMDDLTLRPEYTYKGQPINFQWSLKPTESDRVFLDEVQHSELFHYGVQGMKWGHRRPSAPYNTHSVGYKNARRSGAGKVEARTATKRKVEIENLSTSKSGLDELSKTVKEASNVNASLSKMRSKHVDLSKMTDQELRTTVARINLENQYRNLTAPEVSKGHAYASKILDTSGTVLAIGSSALAIAISIKQLRGK